MKIRLSDNKEYTIEDFMRNISYSRDNEKLDRIVFKVVDELSFGQLQEAFSDITVRNFTILPNYATEVVFQDRKIHSINYRIEDTGIERNIVLQ